MTPIGGWGYATTSQSQVSDGCRRLRFYFRVSRETVDAMTSCRSPPRRTRTPSTPSCRPGCADPRTGKRGSRLNDPASWTAQEVAELRIARQHLRELFKEFSRSFTASSTGFAARRMPSSRRSERNSPRSSGGPASSLPKDKTAARDGAAVSEVFCRSVKVVAGTRNNLDLLLSTTAALRCGPN